MTFAVLSTDGKTPVMQERLHKFANCFENSFFFRRNDILYGILFGSEALFELREDVMLAIFSLSVGCRKIVLPFLFEKYLCEYFMIFCNFSHRSKVIIKGVRSIIVIRYGITIIMGEYSWYTGSYIFLRNKGFDSSHVFLNLFQFVSTIRLFNFLHKGPE